MHWHHELKPIMSDCFIGLHCGAECLSRLLTKDPHGVEQEPLENVTLEIATLDLGTWHMTWAATGRLATGNPSVG